MLLGPLPDDSQDSGTTGDVQDVHVEDNAEGSSLDVDKSPHYYGNMEGPSSSTSDVQCIYA